jgi:soluble lytic murein transglycosylase-like protein
MGFFIDEDSGSTPASVPAPANTASTAAPGGFFIDDTPPPSDVGAIRNAAVQGISGLGGLLDEFLPGFSPKADNALKVVPPHLFGLFGTPKPAASFQNDTNSLATQAGILDNTQPATEMGKYLADVTRNTTASLPLGLGALLYGALGGTGEYVGNSIGGPVGGAVGNLAFSLTPAGLGKLGVLKEIGEQLGPVMSQFPLLNKFFGTAPIESAVGRALGKQATDLPAVEKSLAHANSFVGPPSKLDTFKTVDEITGDAGLARATDAIENAVPNAGFKQLGQDRAIARADDVLSDLKPGVTDYKLSKQLEENFSKGVDHFENKVETPLWDALPKDEPVVANHLNDDLDAAINKITYDGVDPLRGKAAGITALVKNAIANKDGILDIGQVQKLRQEVLAAGRSAKGVLTPEGQMLRETSDALQKHLLNIVDSNAAAGVLDPATATAWQDARAATNYKFAKLSANRDGTKALETIGLKGESLDDTKFIDEGLSSPDKLDSQLAAAKAFGVKNFKDPYKQSLLNSLVDVKNSASNAAPVLKNNWQTIIKNDSEIWNRVFTPQELDKFTKNADDAASFVANERNRITTNSATDTRGQTRNRIFSEKGLADIGAVGQAVPSLVLGYEGAKKGWETGHTPVGSVLRGALGGLLGLTVGKGIKNTISNTSEAFNALAVQALKDPRTMQQVLEAAKPTQFGQKLSGVLGQAAVAGGVKTAGQALAKTLTQPTEITINGPGTVVNRKEFEAAIQSPEVKAPDAKRAEIPEPKLTPIPAELNSLGKQARIEKTASFVDAQPPLIQAIIKTESSGDPFAQSPTGPRGLMQLTNYIAKRFDINDRLDPRQNVKAGTAFLQYLADKYDDPKVILAAYNQGEPVIDKAIKRAGSKNWELVKQFLPAEGQSYPDKVIKNMKSNIVEV